MGLSSQQRVKRVSEAAAASCSSSAQCVWTELLLACWGQFKSISSDLMQEYIKRNDDHLSCFVHQWNQIDPSVYILPVVSSVGLVEQCQV